MSDRVLDERLTHEKAVDQFWLIGGLPAIKLRELEKDWQRDTTHLLKTKEAAFNERLAAITRDKDKALLMEKQLKQILELQNVELQGRIIDLEKTIARKNIEAKAQETSVQQKCEHDMKLAMNRLRAECQLETQNALQKQRNEFLLELQARDRKIDSAFSQHMKITVEQLKQEHEHSLHWRLSQARSESDKQIEELTEALREALRGGTPIGWLRI